jgi:hypothetical protein
MNDSGQNPGGRHSLASDAKTAANEDMTLAETLEAERATQARAEPKGHESVRCELKK